MPNVMAFVGYNSNSELPDQISRLSILQNSSIKPDIICDVSTCISGPSLWEVALQQTDFEVAAVPIYATASRREHINSSDILHDIVRCATNGVKRITIHPTPDINLLAKAQKRLVPCTSRGGAIVLSKALSCSWLGNAYSEILDEVAAVAREYAVTICVGSSFRGANIFDAMDEVNVLDIQKQIMVANFFKVRDVDVIIEGPGHISIKNIPVFSRIINHTGFKVMPLGPVISEFPSGSEQISAAIGAVILGLSVEIETIAIVTNAEHSGGFPTVQEISDAVASAKVASSIIESNTAIGRDEDIAVVMNRVLNNCCAGDNGCTRCGPFCPLICRG